MQSYNRFIPDAAFAIRTAAAAAITADTLISAGELKTPLGAIWDAEPAHGKVAFFVKTSSIFDDDGDETYALEIVSSANADLSSPQVHLSKTLGGGGEDAEGVWHEFLVDTETLVRDDPDAKYFGLRVNVEGTDPSIKVEAYVLPPVGK